MPDARSPVLDRTVCIGALNARDARFDGVFFVGVATTGVYCRPVCPSRFAHDENRRFFASAAAAEHAGFRPCLRCRPELAPGRARCDAVSRLAADAVHRIGAGALNGGSVGALAAELGVSERHLRRVLHHELGIPPLALAQTHRLLLAKQLLADTDLSVTQIAYASGFQSLRRFNAAFLDRYGLSPGMLRRGGAVPARAPQRETASGLPDDAVGLTLDYRAPLAWDALLATLSRDALPGVERVEGTRYARTVRLGAGTGVVIIAPGAASRGARPRLRVAVSLGLLPALMPVLARLRQLFDLDAEPAAVDACLAGGGLAAHVQRRPGLRLPGAFDGFETALGALLRGGARDTRALARRVMETLGAPVETGLPGLDRLAPTAARVAEAGSDGLAALGVPRLTAEVLAAVARAVADGMLSLESGGDPHSTRTALMGLGVGERAADEIIGRALCWPDAFAAADPALQQAAGVTDAPALAERAERWRPWRAYAALHLRASL